MPSSAPTGIGLHLKKRWPQKWKWRKFEDNINDKENLEDKKILKYEEWSTLKNEDNLENADNQKN